MAKHIGVTITPIMDKNITRSGDAPRQKSEGCISFRIMASSNLFLCIHNAKRAKKLLKRVDMFQAGDHLGSELQ